MKLEILLSCMNQQDHSLIAASGITGDAVVVNQCGREERKILPNVRGTVCWIDSAQTGLTRSRNLALDASRGDVCLLCDDDELFVPNYAELITDAYRALPQADVIVFRIGGWRDLGNRPRRVRFPDTMHVASWQISFRRERLAASGVRFDELLGAGTGNGAEEELKFLTDCTRKGLKVYYWPEEIARVDHRSSTWFRGFDGTFFYNRGATTRYILGYPTAMAYGAYYLVRKYPLYRRTITPVEALRALLRGMGENKIGKQAQSRKESEKP